MNLDNINLYELLADKKAITLIDIFNHFHCGFKKAGYIFEKLKKDGLIDEDGNIIQNKGEINK